MHEFIDIAKHGCPDLRHRAVLHNCDLGPELAARAFADLPDAREIALFHVRQDLRGEPSLADWMAHCDLARLPHYRDAARIGSATVEQAADHLRLEDAEPLEQLWAMLTLPARLAPDYGDAANALLMNGIGPVIARLVFGPPRVVPRRGGGETVIDFGWVCEGMIVASARHVPPLNRVLDAFDERAPR